MEENTLSILIVDDDEPTQNLLRAVLRKCGYASDVASNGEQAIGLLRQKRYAAVVLDMMIRPWSRRSSASHSTSINWLPQ